MIKVYRNGVWILRGREIIEDCPENREKLKNLSLSGGGCRETGLKGTIAAGILLEHHDGNQQDKPLSLDGKISGNKGDVPPKELRLRFDAMASHDITYVNIIQTAKACGLDVFPVPYILTNCHNSLCAVGGTINADDHLFGLSAAMRYGGIYVPPHLAVIHSYMREKEAASGRMILGSDSHTRYGALGTMGIGEGGGELVKQLLRQTYDIPWPRIIAVYLSGKPRHGTGPQDIALAIIGAVFRDGYAKNSVLEFIGDGVGELDMDFRAGIDVMTTETTCLSSIWETDETTRQFFHIHRREAAYRRLYPADAAYYNGMIHVDLSKVKPMIALPFHPSNVYELDNVLANPGDIFRKVEKNAAEVMENPNLKLKLTGKIDSRGRIRVEQAIVAGCAGGTFNNIMALRSIMEGGNYRDAQIHNSLDFSVYPGSQSVLLELAKNGTVSSLVSKGVIFHTAFCGPCFGAGDVPPNTGLSIRHTTRNFPNREGSKPGEGQVSSVCLMDARSIAATALSGGYLSSIESLDWEEKTHSFSFDDAPYLARVYNGFGKGDKSCELRYGPNITDWPAMEGLGENLLLKIVSFITDPVTTTDELIPSGETSSFRSNPLGLAEFTLSRKDPAYAGKAKAVRDASGFLSGGELCREASDLLPELPLVLGKLKNVLKVMPESVQLCSAIFARKPGDGSAREQAASCQRVLGGRANFACEYATKRYRSNLINWGILPFILEGEPVFKNGDYVFIPGIAGALREEAVSLGSYVFHCGGRETESPEGGELLPFTLKIPELTLLERELILSGSLINYNRRLMERR